MSNLYVRTLAAGCAAVLAATLAATPALAATTWTIRPGGAITATAGKTNFKDIRNGRLWSEFTCQSGNASGTLKSGSGLPGSRAGSLSAAGFTACSGPDGPRLTLQAAGLPWHVNLSSYDAATGVVTGTVTHIRIPVSGNGCTFVIGGTSAATSDGKVRFTYTDSTGQFTVLGTSGNLHIWNVSAGCLGGFNTGDRARLIATFAVSPEQAITSP
jgi:hypothetical protein